MNKFLTIITFFTVFVMQAQEVTPETYVPENDRFFGAGWVSGHSGLGLSFGMNYFPLEKLNREISNLYGKGFGSNMMAFGFSVTETLRWGRKFDYDQHVDFYYLRSQPSLIKQPNSLNYFLSGFYFGMDWCKDMFPKKRRFDLLIGIGFNTGQLTFKKRDVLLSEDFNKSKNPFFAPKFGVEPRVFITKKIFFSIKGEIQGDVSKSIWKPKSDLMDPLPGTKAHGYSVHVTLGFGG